MLICICDILLFQYDIIWKILIKYEAYKCLVRRMIVRVKSNLNYIYEIKLINGHPLYVT